MVGLLCLFSAKPTATSSVVRRCLFVRQHLFYVRSMATMCTLGLELVNDMLGCHLAMDDESGSDIAFRSATVRQV